MKIDRSNRTRHPTARRDDQRPARGGSTFNSQPHNLLALAMSSYVSGRGRGFAGGEPTTATPQSEPQQQLQRAIDQVVGLWNKYSLAKRWLKSTGSLTEDKKRMRTYAKVMLGISVFFWLWAMYNTSKMKKGKKDLGIFSFFGSACTSIMILTKCWSDKPTGIGAVLVFISHMVVAANYGLGYKFAKHFGYRIFGAYCIIFIALWIIAARVGWILISNVHEHNRVAEYKLLQTRRSKERATTKNNNDDSSDDESVGGYDIDGDYESSYSSSLFYERGGSGGGDGRYPY